jgi:invasion protein IalB
MTSMGRAHSRRASFFMSSVVAVAALSGTMTSARDASRQGSAQQPPATPQTLPGGASQLQETYGDWRVTCVQQNAQKICTLAQQQADKDSRQLVLGIELRTVALDMAEGTMVLPFGLSVDKPIGLQIDEGAVQTTHFRTCLPVGCLVALTFDSGAVSSLKKGTMLNVKAAAEGGRETVFKVSLKGFAGAFDRTAALTK